MTYCIKCCTRIEKSQDQSVVRITTGQRIVKDMKEGCLCTVLWSISRLKNMPPTFVFKVYIKEKIPYLFDFCVYIVQNEITHIPPMRPVHILTSLKTTTKTRNLKQSSNNLFWVCFILIIIESSPKQAAHHDTIAADLSKMPTSQPSTIWSCLQSWCSIESNSAITNKHVIKMSYLGYFASDQLINLKEHKVYHSIIYILFAHTIMLMNKFMRNNTNAKESYNNNKQNKTNKKELLKIPFVARYNMNQWAVAITTGANPSNHI